MLKVSKSNRIKSRNDYIILESRDVIDMNFWLRIGYGYSIDFINTNTDIDIKLFLIVHSFWLISVTNSKEFQNA